MNNQETVNITETLEAIETKMNELLEGFKSRSEGTQALTQFFLNVMKDKESFLMFWDNAEIREKVKNSTEGLLNMSKTYDPNFIKTIDLSAKMCESLRQMIQVANKDGAKIV